MGCNKRLFLLSVCTSQLVTTIWRQIFDFLGFMWGPIIVNFFQIIFSIFGIFGSWQFKSSYIIGYVVWTVIWCFWNAFVFCFYENVGVLDRENDGLSFGTGSESWWRYNGPGCKALFLSNETGEEKPWAPLRPHVVSDCLIPYQHLEAAQAIFHLSLALVGSALALSLNHTIKNGKEATPSTLKKPTSAPLYPVDLMPRRPQDTTTCTESSEEHDNRQCKPMTPRRVKRRSISRVSVPPYNGTLTHLTHQHSHQIPTTHHHSHHHGQPLHPGSSFPKRQNHHRSSTRSSSRRPRQNPVTRLLDHQESRTRGHTNLMFQHSPENSLSYEPPPLVEERPPSARSSYSNYHGTRPHSYRHSHNFLVQGPPGYSSQSETAI